MMCVRFLKQLYFGLYTLVIKFGARLKQPYFKLCTLSITRKIEWFKTRRKVSRQFLEPFCSRVLGGLREVPTIARGLRSVLPLLTCAATSLRLEAFCGFRRFTRTGFGVLLRPVSRGDVKFQKNDAFRLSTLQKVSLYGN